MSVVKNVPYEWRTDPLYERVANEPETDLLNASVINLAALRLPFKASIRTRSSAPSLWCVRV